MGFFMHGISAIQLNVSRSCFLHSCHLLLVICLLIKLLASINIVGTDL